MFTVLCFNLMVVLQVAVIKTYCIEDVALGRSCVKFGNHDRIPGCFEVYLCLCLFFLPPFLAFQLWKEVPWGGFQISTAFTQCVKGRLELAEHCKLLVVGEMGNTAEGRCEDFEWEAGWNVLAQKPERRSVLKYWCQNFPFFPHSQNSISSLLLPSTSAGQLSLFSSQNMSSSVSQAILPAYHIQPLLTINF